MSRIKFSGLTKKLFVIMLLSSINFLYAAVTYENHSPTIIKMTGTQTTVTVDVSESATIYIVAVGEWADAPSASQIKAGLDSLGSSAIGTGSKVLSSSPYYGDVVVTGMTNGQSYDYYMTTEDSSGTLGAVKYLARTSSKIYYQGVTQSDCWDTMSVSSSGISGGTRNFGCSPSVGESSTIYGVHSASAGDTCSSSSGSYSTSNGSADGLYCFATYGQYSGQKYYGYVEKRCGNVARLGWASGWGTSVIIPADSIETACNEQPNIVSLTENDSNPTGTNTQVSFDITFNENVTGVDINDFEVYNVDPSNNYGTPFSPDSISSSSCSPTCTITVTTGSNNGWKTEIYNLNNGTIKDLAGAPISSSGYSFSASYTLDASIVSNDSTSTVTSNSTLSEPSTISTIARNTSNDISILDFTITDPIAGDDGNPTIISNITVDVTGTSTDAQRALMKFILNGPDITDLEGSYDSSTDKITFDLSGSKISVADDSLEVYTISAYFNDNSINNDLSDGTTIILSINASDFTTSGTTSTFASSQSDVNNGAGVAIDILATALFFTTQPSGSVSGSNLTIQL